ncbi:hypothetical protein V5R04_07365 [Jonesiaceae bacterium BS-20]|uniref:Uncharacterized protein n=1 Tax=Jonesiaceae bacterium BS-20 TaxID=3120821 RepID=A0AAU7E0E2_9MICO
MTGKPPRVPDRRAAYYVGRRCGSRLDLLLGPFPQRIMADAAVGGAQEMACLEGLAPSSGDVGVLTLPVPEGIPLPAGRLNHVMTRLAA